MSYCRWSSDKFKSDVYTYAHVDGTWTTHVAGRRRIGTETLPPDPIELLHLPNDEWNAANAAFHEALDKLPFEDIELPHSGETFKDNTPQECANTLRMLQSHGYHVPDGVIDELASEELEEASHG